MGWFEKNASFEYSLGPNLKQELFDPNIVPEINGANGGDVYENGVGHPNRAKYVFWTAYDFTWGRNGANNEHGYARLSYHCNWRFININAAFREAVGNASAPCSATATCVRLPWWVRRRWTC